MRKWGFKRDLYWCPTCNIPLRSELCGKCGGKAIKVKINEPGDLRPAFNGDLKFIEEALINEFGNAKLMNKLGIGDNLTFLNRVPHYDDMKEVIVNGVIVGRLYFDPYRFEWRWRLNKLSALEALNEGLIKHYVRDSAKPLEVVDSAINVKDGEQAAIINKNGDIIALAIAKRGKFRVQIIFKEGKELPEPFKSRSTMNDVLKGNDEYLRTLISRSLAYLVVISERIGLPTVLSYSGGKDSLLSLHLALNAGIEPKLLFNDTGLEFPETVSNVYNVSRMYGLELITANAGDKFWHSVNVFGPPAKDYRWCCKVVKLIPIAKTYKKYFPQGLLVIIGQRALESIDRSWSGRVWRNRWLPLALNTTPIREWDQLSEWLYIIKNKLPVNPLYFRGFDRLGCYLCPAAYIAEYYIVSKEHPELWERWLNVLNEWCTKLCLPKQWVRFHLWRWLNPLGQGRRRVELWLGLKKPSNWIKEYERRSGLTITGYEINGGYVIKIKEGISVEGIVKQYRIIGRKLTVSNGNVVILDSEREIRVSKHTIEVRSSENPFEYAVLTLKLAIRWCRCVSCGNCSLWCPRGAISLSNERPEVNPEKCNGCGICVEVCPLAEVFTEKLIVSRLIGNPKGRPRRLKALSLEYVKALRKKQISEEDRDSEIKEYYEGISGLFSEEGNG